MPSTLDETRAKIILIGFYIASFFCLVLMLIRITEGNNDMVISSGVALLVSISAIYFCRRNYSQHATIISGIVFIIIAFIEGYRLGIIPTQR